MKVYWRRVRVPDEGLLATCRVPRVPDEGLLTTC